MADEKVDVPPAKEVKDTKPVDTKPVDTEKCIADLF
jgi:hypothetical protein